MVAFCHHPYRFDGRVETAFRGGLCLCRRRSLITNLYIDGFNLYYSWTRRRLRSVVWKQRGQHRFAGLRAQGVTEELAAQTAGSTHGPWRISRSPALSYALPTAFFAALGLPRLISYNRTTRRTAVYGPVRTVV